MAAERVTAELHASSTAGSSSNHSCRRPEKHYRQSAQRRRQHEVTPSQTAANLASWLTLMSCGKSCWQSNRGRKQSDLQLPTRVSDAMSQAEKQEDASTDAVHRQLQ